MKKRMVVLSMEKRMVALTIHEYIWRKKIMVLFKPFCHNVSHTEQLSQINTLTNIN